MEKDAEKVIWTQAMCTPCWEAIYGNQVPHRLKSPIKEICGWCGEPTFSGIYLRAAPESVKYPRMEVD